jgi:hypothetical protein
VASTPPAAPPRAQPDAIELAPDYDVADPVYEEWVERLKVPEAVQAFSAARRLTSSAEAPGPRSREPRSPSRKGAPLTSQLEKRALPTSPSPLSAITL